MFVRGSITQRKAHVSPPIRLEKRQPLLASSTSTTASSVELASYTFSLYPSTPRVFNASPEPFFSASLSLIFFRVLCVLFRSGDRQFGSNSHVIVVCALSAPLLHLYIITWLWHAGRPNSRTTYSGCVLPIDVAL